MQKNSRSRADYESNIFFSTMLSKKKHNSAGKTPAVAVTLHARYVNGSLITNLFLIKKQCLPSHGSSYLISNLHTLKRLKIKEKRAQWALRSLGKLQTGWLPSSTISRITTVLLWHSLHTLPKMCIFLLVKFVIGKTIYKKQCLQSCCSNLYLIFKAT